MSELVWDRVRWCFDVELVGTLPDLWVEDTTVADWQVVFDVVSTGPWRWGWRWLEEPGEQGAPLPPAVDVFARPDGERLVVDVFVTEDVLVKLWPMQASSIDLDCDARQVHDQQRLDAFCGFLTVLGRALGTSVWMGGEGSTVGAQPLLGFDATADRVVLVAEPPPRSWSIGRGRGGGA